MQIHNKLDEVFKQPAKIKILRFLFNNDDEFTGRAVARSTGLSVSNTYVLLQKMRAEGLINVKRKGNAILYSLKKDSRVVKDILSPLYEKEKNIYKDIASIIKRIFLARSKRIRSIAIFGSVAKKEDTSASDIDLLVITEDAAASKEADRAINDLNNILAREYSLAASVYLLTISQFKAKYRREFKLIKSILDNNKLIYGEPIERIIA